MEKIIVYVSNLTSDAAATLAVKTNARHCYLAKKKKSKLINVVISHRFKGKGSKKVTFLTVYYSLSSIFLFVGTVH